MCLWYFLELRWKTEIRCFVLLMTKNGHAVFYEEQNRSKCSKLFVIIAFWIDIFINRVCLLVEIYHLYGDVTIASERAAVIELLGTASKVIDDSPSCLSHSDKGHWFIWSFRRVRDTLSLVQCVKKLIFTVK